MTENAGELNEELASAFIFTMCQLIPKPPPVYYDHTHNLLGSKHPVPTYYIVLCGSHAEFYIRPLITCMDDLDFLVAKADELAFSGEFPVLPRDFSGLVDTIECYKIEPYDRYPGFVRLRHWGEMNYKFKFSKYAFNYAADTNVFVTLDLDCMTDLYYPLTRKGLTTLNRI